MSQTYQLIKRCQGRRRRTTKPVCRRHDSDPETTFGYVARQLDTRGIGYLHAVEPRIKSTETIGEVHDPVAARHLRPKFTGARPSLHVASRKRRRMRSSKRVTRTS
jgi:hypothetical protein